ncbi:DUF6716 putative glycosyltransferase [Streptomyces sp. 7-21]|uniref:DUF6716 putative glycosyltransferase n=1 Tax=Streptomyces sp. 7-21 TaxID=2802283 RepID=UPI00191F7DE5|nr:DUF6716 putative glycosyltransferase [Streptomyces sp. 7-21]MBL1068646.1 hypothetical protein [Streptomyces sp. 7-21]
MGSATPRVVVLADSDSRWKWAALVARKLTPDHAIDARFLYTSTTPTERQIAEVGVEPDTSRIVTYGELVDDPAVHEADVVIFGTIGGTVLALLHSLGLAWEGSAHRPVTVSGYVGVVYENLVDGLLLRVGSDMVLANCAHDAEQFREIYESVGADPECVVESGLPFLGGEPYDPTAAGRKRPFTVCFAVQPTVPSSRAARMGMLEKLQRHARLHPDREVLIKLRNQPGEAVTHLERHSYQTLYDELPDPPPNLKIIYGDMGEALDRTDLLVTVSSTAAMEAIHRGIPTAILTDYGVREAHGNHYFIHSGCLASWSQLDEGLIPKANPAWAASRGIGQRDPFMTARARLRMLRARGSLPLVRPYYTPLNASDYLESLLVRRGLGLSGRPLPSAGSREPTAVRRLIRRGAGGLYRVGRQKVAPVIRRLANG